MKVRIVRRPTGYFSIAGGPLHEWPKVGDVIDLPDTMAENAIDSGNAKALTKAEAEAEAGEKTDEKVETRPANTDAVETRTDTPVKRGPGRPRKTQG
jgi:hypothetical protein